MSLATPSCVQKLQTASPVTSCVFSDSARLHLNRRATPRLTSERANAQHHGFSKLYPRSALQLEGVGLREQSPVRVDGDERDGGSYPFKILNGGSRC